MASVFMCGVEDLLFSGSRFVWTVTVAALRRWYAARLRACRQALRAWCGLRDVYQVKKKKKPKQQKPSLWSQLFLGTAAWHLRGCVFAVWAGSSLRGWDGVRSIEAALGRCSEDPEPGSELVSELLSKCLNSGFGGGVSCARYVLSVNLQVFWQPLGAPLGAVTIGIWGTELRELLSACTLRARCSHGRACCGFFGCVCVTE